MTFSKTEALAWAERMALRRKIRERKRLLDQHMHFQGAQSMPRIRMIVSPWFTADDGLQTRLVQAAE